MLILMVLEWMLAAEKNGTSHYNVCYAMINSFSYFTRSDFLARNIEQFLSLLGIESMLDFHEKGKVNARPIMEALITAR